MSEHNDAFAPVAKVSRETGVPKSQVFIWGEEGKIPGLRVGHGPILFRVSDVRRVIAENQLPAEAFAAERQKVNQRMAKARAARKTSPAQAL